MSQPIRISASVLNYFGQVMDDETPEQRLGSFLDEHFQACMDDISESRVLHEDYGWSVQQIIALRNSRQNHVWTSEDDPYFCEIEVLRELTTPYRAWRFDWDMKAQRVFFFFYFLEINQIYREEAQLQFSKVRDLIDEDLLSEVATILNWNEHQRLECHLVLQGKGNQP